MNYGITLLIEYNLYTLSKYLKHKDVYLSYNFDFHC